ncbi:MAG: PIG-L family deacetylase [Actinomycetota bacterium]
MATLVCFHAHPDDEAIATGGLMAKAAAAGHRVVLVCATRGEVGEPQPGVLADGEELWERRMVELAEAAKILGAEEPRWLGYEDSGMMGEPTNDNPACFWQSDHDEAVERLRSILDEVDADVLTIYDDHGGYGHPDHIRVHTVGLAAARAAGLEGVYESTINRDAIKAMRDAAPDEFGPDDGDDDDNGFDFETVGTPTADITYQVDVSAVVGAKRAAMAAHRSQIGPDTFFLSMPDELFAQAFGREWFNVPGRVSNGAGPATVETLPGLG